MTRTRVYIATTEGPVAVQKITAEDPDVPSVACRDGTTEVLAISRDYTRFVDRGTGIVAALTGHGAYRLDLDRPVDGGRSWQLPVLLAHLIEAEGRLAGPDEPADLVLLATGEVDRERRVRPVGRMREKLAAAGDLIARHREDGPPLSVLLPVADRTPEIEERLPGGEDASAGTVRFIAWERVGSLAELEPRTAGAAAPAPGGSEDASRRRLRVFRTAVVLFLLLAAAGLGAGAAWWNGPRHWEALRRAGDYAALERALQEAALPPLADRYRSGLLATAPPAESLVFSLVERRTPDGRPCSPRIFRGMNRAGGADPVETAVAPRKEGFFRSERGASLCRVVYRVANQGERLVYLYFAVRPVLSVAAGGPDVAPFRRGAALPSGASLTLDLELDRNPDHVLGADLLVLAAPSPSPQIRRTFEIATGGNGASGDRTTRSLDLTDLPALGLTVKGASHAILR